MSFDVVSQKWGGLIVAPIVASLTWLTAGIIGKTHLTEIVGASSILVSSAWCLFYNRYFGMLVASSVPKSEACNSQERRDYDKLRDELSTKERIVSRLYSRTIKRGLDATDRFFGDAGNPNNKLSKNVFRLDKPFPLWTAASFDTCLMLALVYPIVTLFFFWVVSGQVGPAEEALELRGDFSLVERCLASLAVIAQVVAMNRYVDTKSFIFAAAAFIVAAPFAVAVSVAAAGAIGLAQGAYFGAKVPPFGGVLLGIAWIVTFTIATALRLRDWNAALLAIAVALVFASTMFVNRAIPSDRLFKRVYLASIVPITILVCFSAAYFLSTKLVWNFIGPLLLFGALLTVLNAPFDWLSLGLTRWLLRRGIEKGGWSPLLFSVSDAVLATVLIAALVPVLVVGVQFFDRIAEHGGGHSIFLLQNFFTASKPIRWRQSFGGSMRFYFQR